MKTGFQFILFFGFILSSIQAQECDFPLPPANICQNAPLLCDLDGYCSNNADAVNSGTPNAFCGQVENNHWVAFIAGSPTFVLEMRVDNCNQGSGLQAQVFSTTNCQFFTAVSNCIDPVITVATLTATELTIGEQYYLMVDGKGGDICDYSFRLLEGETLSPAEAIIQPAGALCLGETIELASVGTSPNADLSYQWTSVNGNILEGASSPTITIDTPGDYQVSIVDAAGCTDSTSISIPLELLPEFSIMEPGIINCLTNLQVDLMTNPVSPDADYNYSWSTTNGSIINGASTAMPTVDQAGTYQLMVTDNLTGCVQTDSVDVTADANTPTATISGAGELNCLVPTINLSGAGSSMGTNFSYNWSNQNGNFVDPPTGLTAIVDTPGIYSLEVVNQENGCVDDFSVQVTENAAIPTGLEVSLANPCFQLSDGSIEIGEVYGGTPPYLFSFDGSIFQGQNNYTDLAAGTYPISVQDQTGCTWDTTYTLIESPPFILDLGEDQEIAMGCEYEIKPLFNRAVNEIDTFIWMPPIACDDCIFPTIQPLRTIAYELQAIDINGCRAEDQFRIFVREDRNVYFPNVFSPNNDGTNDVFFIQAGKDAAEVLSFRIYNRWGTLIADYGAHLPNDPSTGWRGFAGSKLAPTGVYIYQVELRFIDEVVKQYNGDIILMR